MVTQARKHRKGTTLLELSVVLGIIGALAAVTLPAIQGVRESMRRMSCQNNLLQVSLAIQSFEDSQRQLPSLYNGSFIDHPKNQWDEQHFHSWQAAILPQLDQTALYDRIDQSLPATDRSNQPNVNVELSVFICPSTSNHTPVVPDITQRVPVVKVGTAARSDYEAIGGVLMDPKTGGFGARPYDHIRLGVWGLPRYHRSGAGVFGRMHQTQSSDITDGLSNTIVVGEMAGRPDIYKRGEPDQLYVECGDGPVGKPAWAISGNFSAITLSERYGVNESNQMGLYSFHATGANVALADGSVRHLSNDTDRKVLHALATSSGGESLPLD